MMRPEDFDKHIRDGLNKEYDYDPELWRAASARIDDEMSSTVSFWSKHSPFWDALFSLCALGLWLSIMVNNSPKTTGAKKLRTVSSTSSIALEMPDPADDKQAGIGIESLPESADLTSASNGSPTVFKHEEGSKLMMSDQTEKRPFTEAIVERSSYAEWEKPASTEPWMLTSNSELNFASAAALPKKQQSTLFEPLNRSALKFSFFLSHSSLNSQTEWHNLHQNGLGLSADYKGWHVRAGLEQWRAQRAVDLYGKKAGTPDTLGFEYVLLNNAFEKDGKTVALIGKDYNIQRGDSTSELQWSGHEQIRYWVIPLAAGYHWSFNRFYVGPEMGVNIFFRPQQDLPDFPNSLQRTSVSTELPDRLLSYQASARLGWRMSQHWHVSTSFGLRTAPSQQLFQQDNQQSFWQIDLNYRF